MEDEKNRADIKKVIWALDVFTDISDLEETVVRNVSSLFTSLQLKPEITPVNVFPGIHIENHFPFVAAEITSRLDKIKDFKLKPVQVIPENMIYPTSIDDKVDTLVKYVQNNHCDLVIATTHSRQQASHHLIGSFSKELISKSPVSMLLINPSCKIKSHFGKVLLPLESVKMNELEIDVLRAFITRMGASLTLFFHLQDQISNYFDIDGTIGQFLKIYNTKRATELEVRQSELKKMLQDKITHLKFENTMDPKSFRESVCSYLQQNEYDLVVLNSLKSKENKSLSTNTIEFIARNSNCPVLILR